MLGIDVAPLLTSYDERYADAPINPRRVFEAELATGANGSIRSTRGGPNWSVLVAAVMALVLAWSIARLVMDTPPELRGATPVLNGSGGPGGAGTAPPADPVPVVLTAAAGGAHVVVRDGAGEVVFKGNLAVRPDPRDRGLARRCGSSPPTAARRRSPLDGQDARRARRARRRRPGHLRRPTDRYRVPVRRTARCEADSGVSRHRRRHTRRMR